MNENYLLQNEKNRFLADEFFILSWCAAMQRNQTFAALENGADKTQKDDYIKKKENFRETMKNAIFRMLPLYAETMVSREQHKKNIEELIKISGSDEYKSILKDFDNHSNDEEKIESSGKLKAGTAQKLLNMMLKYCWCAGWINMPPDMPIDKHNLDEIFDLSKDNDFKKSWTKDLVDIDDYSKMIEKLEGVVNEPLSVWELIHWRRDADE